jgi:hypothetical protein
LTIFHHQSLEIFNRNSLYFFDIQLKAAVFLRQFVHFEYLSQQAIAVFIDGSSESGI